MNRKINISIKGAYGESNFGDDLLMLVFENYFLTEFQNLNLNFVGEESSYPMKLLKKSTYNTENYCSDLLVYGGGTQFFSFRNKSESFIKKCIKVIYNPNIILDRFFHKKNDISTKNITLLGFGLGPFGDDYKAIDRAKEVLRLAKFVGVRDKISYQYCEKWGIESYLGADVVFSSYFDDFLTNIERKKRSVIKNIGIIVRDWEYYNSEYIEKIQLFSGSNQYKTTFILFAPDKDKKWVKRLANKDNVLIWQPNIDTVESFLNKLNDFDCIISARYHGAILSILLGIPTVCIDIEPKLSILSEQIDGLPLWKSNFDIKQLENYINGFELTRNDYRDSLSELRLLSDNMLQQFKQFLLDEMKNEN
ncbi:polysaccharide pyruvyl transferase family protein [Lonepinella koalarum]|uniref:polysaccharide pyruvyl transferase family protein n=1 Tax=Lonepinella koalarum TaxID=53417 RepID=UPI003F6DC364